IPVVYFVSPQLWAWRQSRLELVKKYVTKMLVIFPFEEAWYRERGVEAEYVGHPLVDEIPTAPPSELEVKPIIALLPGSRKAEIEAHVPQLVQVMLSMGDGFRFVIPVASTLSDKQISTAVDTAARATLGLEHDHLAETESGPQLPIHWYSRDARDALR